MQGCRRIVLCTTNTQHDPSHHHAATHLYCTRNRLAARASEWLPAPLHHLCLVLVLAGMNLSELLPSCAHIPRFPSSATIGPTATLAQSCPPLFGCASSPHWRHADPTRPIQAITTPCYIMVALRIQRTPHLPCHVATAARSAILSHAAHTAHNSSCCAPLTFANGSLEHT